MAIGINEDIPYFEGGDTWQFTLTMTPSPPSSVQFIMYNTDGATLAPTAVQSGLQVATSGTGLFYVNRILPESPGFYTQKFVAFDSASRPYVTAGMFEIRRTEATSFFSYADLSDVYRTARALFGTANVTQADARFYCEAADGIIDSYLRKITTVPLSPTPNLIRDISKVFAIWAFTNDRYSAEKERAPSGIDTRKDYCVKLLDMVVSGSLSIGLGPDPTTITTLPDGTRKAVFDMREWESQRVSPNLIDAEDALDDV